MSVKKTAENAIGKGKAGPGRPKGLPNKQTAAIKDMIIGALDRAGGVDYLVEQSEKNPTAFMGLVGKVLPMQLAGADGGELKIIINKPGA
jgi:hypothetical protein